MTKRSFIPVGWRAWLQASALASAIGWIATGGTENPASAQAPESVPAGTGQPTDAAQRSGSRGGSRGRRFGEPSAFDLLQRAEVRDDLKITDDQSKKIDELTREFDKQRQELGAIFRSGTSAEDLQKAGEQIREKSDALRRSAEIHVKEILTSDQFRRYGQIKLQIAGISELRHPETADALKLTDAQRTEVSKARDEADAKMRTLGFFGSSEARQKISEERDAALLAILTAEQKVAWQAALGTPLAAAKPAVAADKKPVDSSEAQPKVEAAAPKSGKDVVADFAGTNAGAAGARNSESHERTLSFSFRFAPWEMVLRRFAEEAGLTLDMNDVPPGTLNHYDNQKYTPSEALDVLNGYLLRRGFLLVRRDRFLVVVNIDNGIPPNLIPQVSASELPKRGRNELLSVVFPLTDADAKTAAEDVKELLGPQGKVVPLTKVNRLLVTDIGANLLRVNELLTGLGVVEDAKGTGFRSFKLFHVSAVDAERMIRDLFNLPARGSATRAAALAATIRPPTSTDRRDDRDRDRGRGGWDWRGGGGGGGRWGDGNGGQSTPAPTGTPAPVASTSKIQLTIDTRTNTLLVTASGEDLHLIEQAIKTIDVAEAGSAIQSPIGRRSNQPQVEVYPVENADIQVVVDMIDATVPGLTLRTDAKTRRINVFATPDEQEQVRNIVKQLDGGAGESVTVIQLHKIEPSAAATSLRNLFSANRTDPPSIEADSLGRRLMVRGSPEQVSQIRKLLADLGEEGDGVNLSARSGGPIRTVAPGSRSAEELVELVQRLMPQSEGSFIRVVPPSAIAGPSFRLRDIDEPVNRGSRQFRRVPAAAETEDESGETPDIDVPRQPQRNRRSETADPADIERLSRELEAALEDLDETVADELDESAADAPVDRNPSEQVDASSTAAAEPGAEDVRITSYDGKVIIASENLKALDQLERLLQSLAQTASRKTRWTVYYLRSADATETATILGSLFPAGSVTQPSSSSSGLLSGFRGGFASLGSSLMEATGLGSMSQNTSLRILPETRSNALFIAGPDDQVQQVLEALEVLDAAQLPASLKDRTPRRIAVEHADVDDVAAIVRDVYKEELDPPQAANPMQGGRGGGFNPLAMLMGAGGNQNTKQRGVQLTIGVDRRTSTLVVSASDQLFRQIEDLVQSLDESAKEARRTVRVAPIRNGSSELVETALKPLLGKVSVSSTGRTTPSNGPSGGPPSGTGGPSGNSDDSRRAFFQQMMMERMMQGGGGGAPFGRGGNGNDGGGRRSGFGQGGDFGGRRSRSGNN